MGVEYSAARAKLRAAGVSVVALSALLLSACSSDPRPPADVGFHSAAIAPPELPEPVIQPEPVLQSEPTVQPEPTVQMAQAFPAPENPGESLSEEEARRVYVDPAEPEIDQPPMSEPEPPVQAAMPRPERKGWFQWGDAPDTGGLPATEAACRKKLKKLRVSFTEMNPIRDSASCAIPYPVKVSAIGGVQIKPAATLNCEMAATFASWTRNELVSSSRWRYMSGIKTIHQGSSYSCRRIRGEGKMSAHSTGSAIDVMAITLNNGKKIDIKKQGFFAFRARGLLNTVRADGCEYFTTVLGPGYNYDHRNHFHFDLMKRRSGKVACH